MNPDKCPRCNSYLDPFDPEYCVWYGQRWHVSCAVRQAQDDIATMIAKQGRYDVTAANYSELQSKIDDMMGQHESLMNILRKVPQQAHDLGLLFIKSEKLVKRDSGGHLLEEATDPRTVLGLLGAERDQIEQGDNNLLEGGSDE